MAIFQFLSKPGLLLVGLAGFVALMYLQYATTQFPKQRGVATLVDFPSFLLSFITLPIIRLFFTIPEKDWNRDREVEGLQFPVDVYRDNMGIPYIFAHTDKDARFAQLFIEYTERPFQLEFLRRLASGHLAETFGKELLATDYRARLLVDADALRYQLTTMTERQRAELDNHIRALNQAQALLPAQPVEFASLGWRPKKWTALEYLQMIEFTQLKFAMGYGVEYAAAELQKHLKQYWPTFDVKFVDNLPPLNTEGDYPSLYDQKGRRVALPVMPSVDDSWAWRRPTDMQKILDALRENSHITVQNSNEQEQEQKQPTRQQQHPAHVSSSSEEDEVEEKEGKRGGAAAKGVTTEDEAAETATTASVTDGEEEEYAAAAPTKTKQAVEKEDEGQEKTDNDSDAPEMTKTSEWTGSNSWVVSGRFTASKKPILSNDTHLQATLPGFWVPFLVSVGSSSKLLTTRVDPSAAAPAAAASATPAVAAAAAASPPPRPPQQRQQGQPQQQQEQHRRQQQPQQAEEEYRITGVSAAGFGKICAGHSEYAAWGQTVAATDVADLFLVTLDEEGRYYKYDNRWYPLRIRTEVFSVKGKPNVEKIFRYTHHGPIISDAMPLFQKLLKPREAVALAIVSNRAPVSSDYFVALGKAKTWKDFLAAGSLDHQLALTTLWATTTGDIGGTVSGAVPVRNNINKAGFRDGSSSAEDWKGILPQTRIPHVVNPKNGYIGMANSKIAHDKEHLYGRSFDSGFRQRRIMEVLKQMTDRGNVIVQDMIQMQNDVHSSHGAEFREYVLRKVLFAYSPAHAAAAAGGMQEKRNKKQQQQQREAATATREAVRNIHTTCKKEGLRMRDGSWLYEIMKDWKGDMSTESVAPAVYDVWAQYTLQILFKKHAFPPEALEMVLGKSPDFTWLPTVETGYHWLHNLMRALQHNESVVRDVTTAEELLCSSAAAALEYLQLRYGKDRQRWKWGLLRACFVDHPLAVALPILRHTTSTGPLIYGGSGTTLKIHTALHGVMSMEKPKDKVFSTAGMAPVFRMVVDLADLKNSYWSVFPGVSGWMGSSHYADLAKEIEVSAGTGHMRRMLWTDEDIAAAAVTHMKLLPRTPSPDKEGKGGRYAEDEL